MTVLIIALNSSRVAIPEMMVLALRILAEMMRRTSIRKTDELSIRPVREPDDELVMSTVKEEAAKVT